MVELSSKWILGALFIWSICRTTQAADDVFMGIDDDWFYRDKGYGGNFGLYRSQRGVSTQFSQMMVMPQACISYNNANYVKFSFYMDSGGQCHGRVLGTYLISIAHYMHAYFNQQALQLGSSFVLPWDAGFLNCVQLPGSSSSSSQKLYARVGCEQHGYVSATKKFQLRVYTDSNCLTPYNYDKSKNKVNVNGYWLSTALSFGAKFSVCEGCTPAQVAASFKKNKYWYDDDYINVQGKSKRFTDDTVSDGSSEVYDDYSHYNDTDDYLQAVTDDKSYFEATDDASYNYSQIVSQQSSVSNSSSSQSYWFSFTVSKRTWTRKPTPAPTPSPTQSIAEGDHQEEDVDEKTNADVTTNAPTPSSATTQTSYSSSKAWWYWNRSPKNSSSSSYQDYNAEVADQEEDVDVDKTTNAPNPSPATTQTSSSSSNAWWYWNRSPKNSNSSSYQDYNNTSYQDGKSWKRYWNRGNGTSYQEYNSSKYQASWKKYWMRGNNGTSYQEANATSYQASRGGNRMLKDAFIPELELYQRQFWQGVQRELESSSSSTTKQVTWNFCERLYNYSFYCDVTCQNRVNAYYKDSWTKADVSVLSFCVILISVITCLIFIKRVKSYERFMLCHCGDDDDTDGDAGLPPIAIALFFVFIMGVIMILANLNLVNQTLVLALFICIALVIIFVRMTVFCGKSSYQRPKDVMGEYDDVRKRIFDAGI